MILAAAIISAIVAGAWKFLTDMQADARADEDAAKDGGAL